MQLAEMAEHVLRPDLDRARAARMEPGWRARYGLQRLHRRAGGGERRIGVALGVEEVDLAGFAGPVAADARGLGERAAHASCGRDLLLRLVALEDLADLEQGDIREAAVGVLLRRGDEAGNETRPHVGKVRRNRIGERKVALAAAE